MSKITPEHLARQAIVYIRQSTADQVANNLESQRRQYNLPERARQLGWSDVAVIDDDLGRSGGGIARPGFEKLLAAICEGRVGVVISIEASRLARVHAKHGSAMTAATGTRCWSSAVSSARSSPTRTAFTIRAIPTTDCCSA
jgi:predicted site-specific integrase-resolvase